MDVWGWLCWVFKCLVNATEVFIEFICGRVCIFNYVSIFVLNVMCGRVRFKTSKFMHTCTMFFSEFWHYGIIEKFLFRLENQGVHFISPNFIVIYIFFSVKFVSTFDFLMIQPGCWHLLTRFFLSGACLSSKERNVSWNNCTAAEGSSYEFIFEFLCILYTYRQSLCLINSEVCVLNRQVRDYW